MSEKKTRLASLRNQDWNRAETEKINELLTHISMNITELYELIYAGAKLVRDKVSVCSKNMNRNTKPGWKIQQGTQIKKLRQQVKRIRQRRNARTR